MMARDRIDYDHFDPEVGVGEDPPRPEPKVATLEPEGPTVCYGCGYKRAFELINGLPVCRTCQTAATIGD